MPGPWDGHRLRAEVLRERYPFAAELFALQLALFDVWDDGWEATRAERPEPRELARWAADRVAPAVVKATEAAGPVTLAESVAGLVEGGAAEAALAAWLAGDGLPPIERYLARASLRAPLEALADLDPPAAGTACAADPAPRGERHCPGCGGPPQLSVREAGADTLVTGARTLICARCARRWSFSASTCPSCGETTGSRRTVYAEPREGPVVAGLESTDGTPAAGPTFPHLRVDACASCRRYLIDVDLGRDPRAVPDVDELAALPLDLYAAEQGLSKITPNLMGF
jgi:hypothetical protein